MNTKTVIESKVQGFTPFWFDKALDEVLDVSTNAEIESFAKTNNLPIPIVRLIVDSLEHLAELIDEDLRDIWSRVGDL